MEDVKKRFGLPELPASAFRRNVVIAGADLNGLIGKRFRIGTYYAKHLSGDHAATVVYVPEGGSE